MWTQVRNIILTATGLVALLGAPTRAEVVRVEEIARTEISNENFGDTGPYEEITGRIVFAVDPANSANRIIRDIDKAPRNQDGKVEFSANFYLLKPTLAARSNGTLLLDVSNRGKPFILRTFNRAVVENKWGDGFLMKQGFTLFSVGWQFDVPNTPAALRVVVPIAREADGRPIRGLVRSDAPSDGNSLALADRGHIPYPVADPRDPANQLTVRDCITCARRIVPRKEWTFSKDGTSVLLSAAEPRKIYELVYTSEGPAIVGLGLVAVRDAVSALKYGHLSELSLPPSSVKRALGFGVSQSGRFLRHFLYAGFNEDESHRKVFDGVIAHVAGAGRGSFNHRFAQPSRDGHPYLNFYYPTDVFPFTDVPQIDPVTGQRDGLTANISPAFLPKIFYSNASYEYWGRGASLIHTDISGKADAKLPDNTRIYVFSSGKHLPGEAVTSASQQQLMNPLDYSWGLRGLLIAMHKWISGTAQPPPSAYPRIDRGTLVTPENLKFPTIPDVSGPGQPTQPYRVDYGPDFQRRGIATIEPPLIGPPFPILVPQVDKDGNDLAGVRMPELAVPLGTYTGWGLFPTGAGLPGILVSGAGSFIPFPRCRAERRKRGDPRRSIEERYPTRKRYLDLIRESAMKLVREGYLLKADVPAVIDAANARWSFVEDYAPSGRGLVECRDN